MKKRYPFAIATLLLAAGLSEVAAAPPRPTAPQAPKTAAPAGKVDQNALLRANAQSGLRSLDEWRKEQAAKKARGQAPCFSPTGNCPAGTVKNPAQSAPKGR